MSHGGGAPSRRATAGAVGFVLLAPVAVFFVLRVRAMAVPTMIDPGFYTAYASNPRGLMLRYGPHNYFWVRIGALLPALAGIRLLGPVPGFYAVRYAYALLATVPAYRLFRRHHGPAAGRLVVLVLLCSPVVLTAWGTDYPDGAALAYLTAGTAALLLDREAPNRWRWVAGCVALALAVHSQAGAAALAAAAVLVAVWWNGGPARARIVRLALAAGTVLATTAAVMIVTRVLFLNADIFTPTRDQAEAVRRDSEIWHTPGVAWMTHVTYLLVPVLVVAVGAVAAVRSRRGGARPTLVQALVLLAGVQTATQFLQQTVGDLPTLEFHLWSSMLWSSVLLALAAALVAIVGDGPARDRTLDGLAAVVVGVPFVLGIVRVGHLEWLPWGLVLVVAAVGIARAAAGRRLLWRGVAAGAVVVLVGVLSVAPVPKRASNVPLGRYDRIFNRDGQLTLDQYRSATDLTPWVEATVPRDENLLLWWPDGDTQRFNPPASQYLWTLNSLGVDLPDLNRADRTLIRKRRVTYLLLLDTTGARLDPAVRALRRAGLDPEVVATRRFGSGAAGYVARIVRIDPDGRP